MNFIRNHIIRPVAVLLALFLLNTSVDVVERSVFKPFEESQSNFNEIESLVEMITELGLNLKDFIPENEGEDDQSLKSKQSLKFIKINSQLYLHETFNTIVYCISDLFNYLNPGSAIFIPPRKN